MKEINIHGKTFVPYLSAEKIDKAVKKVADDMFKEYQGETPVFLGVLNGVIVFFSDLIRYYKGDCEICFMQVASYKGTKSSGEFNVIKEIPQEIEGKHVVIIEDIIDTGNTLEKLYAMIKTIPMKSLKIATLFFKPEAFKKNLSIDFIGMNIPNKFVLGYGLDFNELGRNYKDLYQLKETEK